MLRSRSENNARGTNNRKRGENDEPGLGAVAGKQQENIAQSNDPHAMLLKDKNVNQRSVQVQVSSKTSEKDRMAANSPSQKGSKFKVFSDKENDIAESPSSRKKYVTPVKRPGSNLDVLSPLAKRTESHAPIERGHGKEQELSYIPDIDLDFSGLDDRMDIGVYESAPIEPKIPLETIDESENQKVMNSPVKPKRSIEFPQEIEHGPAQEEELSYEPAVPIDLAAFSELPDLAAYEYVDTDWEVLTHDDDELLHHNECHIEEFDLLTDLEQDPYFAAMEHDDSYSLPFADHLFDVDAYLYQTAEIM